VLVANNDCHLNELMLTSNNLPFFCPPREKKRIIQVNEPRRRWRLRERRSPVMARATGPGKVEERPSPDAQAPEMRRASLFNFDIDGDTLKPEHERWLTENVVPLLSVPGASVRLRGVASRSGAASHNQALSQRRVDKVLAFLQRNGLVLAQFVREAAGEGDAAAAGQVDGTEDERFRAVIVTVVNLLGRLLPVVFERPRRSGLNDGFDDSISPRWVMVPSEDAFRTMQVENAEGLSLVSSNERICVPEPALFRQTGPVRITRSPQIFRIFGRQPGDAEIRAIDGQGRIRGRLLVSILPQLTVTCAFHFISNPRYGTRTRRPGQEAEFLRVLNDIWDAQANIQFQQLGSNVGAAPVVMNNRLGDEINTIGFTVSGDMPVVTRRRDRAAQFNVFFVRETDTDREGTLDANGNATDTVDAQTEIGGNGDCLFEDEAGGPGIEEVIMSHEAGHCLTLDHDRPIRSTAIMLMFGRSDASSRFLPRAHVLQARRNVRRR
jgi:outer membrane protein OmpA-like peptidoglycan-associated protein